MNPDDTLQLAERLGRGAHRGQLRRGGLPYSTHLEDVFQRVKAAGGSRFAQALSWLHDVFEKTPCTPEMLLREGITPGMIRSIKRLTKERYQPYDEYIHQLLLLSSNTSECQVKIADITSNLLDKPSEHQLRKYPQALLLLTTHTTIRLSGLPVLEHYHTTIEGPRIPLRHGTAPTQICAACGAWRMNLHVPGQWRGDDIDDALSEQPEEDEHF